MIAEWVEQRRESPRPVNVLDLYEHLVAEHGYEDSYRSVPRSCALAAAEDPHLRRR